MSRNRIVVVTDPATAEGFLLTGVDVQSYVDPAEARKKVCHLLQDDTTEILVVNDNFLEGADEWVKHHLRSSSPPVLISLPVQQTKGRAAHSSIHDMIREVDAALGMRKEEKVQQFNHYAIQAKQCCVCGHLMEPGMRICDKCGSIARPARARGLHSTPSRTSSCQLCGVEIPAHKTLCSKCASMPRRKPAAPKTSVLRSLHQAIMMFLQRLFNRGGTAD